MRKLFISLVAVIAVAGVSFAQDAGAPIRSLGFYLDADTGRLSKDAEGLGGNNRLFAGNEFEMGMTYSQNFATVPWLSLNLSALVVVQQKGKYDFTAGDNAWEGNSGSDTKIIGNPRAKIGLNLGGYSLIQMDTRGLMANENYYTVDLGKGGAVTFLTILEFWAVPLARSGWEANGLYKHTVLDLFALRVDYSLPFANIWTYKTTVGFRWSDDASAKAFSDSFAFRWENKISVDVTEKLGMWTQVRYQINNLAVKNPGTLSIIDHDITVQAGLSYTFDLSGVNI